MEAQCCHDAAMTSIYEVRAQDGNHVHSIGARETRAEAEALLAESQERVACTGGTNDRYWIEEIPAGHTLYQGREVKGWPAYTISRGEVVYADGSVTAPAGRGRLVRRGRTRPL
jgi:hypothetical protein